MTLLVVASPCALVIATPSAILSGIANGARHGILFKGGAYLDLAGSIDTIAFDKTGTLTFGRPRLVEVVSRQDLRRNTDSTEPPANGAPGSNERSILRIAAAVERTAEHHLARAILDAARQQNQDIPTAEDFIAIPGEGVSGLV
jgi:Cd2+/Zn2+-exporting ATPase